MAYDFLLWMSVLYASAPWRAAERSEERGVQAAHGRGIHHRRHSTWHSGMQSVELSPSSFFRVEASTYEPITPRIPSSLLQAAALKTKGKCGVLGTDSSPQAAPPEWYGGFRTSFARTEPSNVHGASSLEQCKDLCLNKHRTGLKCGAILFAERGQKPAAPGEQAIPSNATYNCKLYSYEEEDTGNERKPYKVWKYVDDTRAQIQLIKQCCGVKNVEAYRRTLRERAEQMSVHGLHDYEPHDHSIEDLNLQKYMKRNDYQSAVDGCSECVCDPDFAEAVIFLHKTSSEASDEYMDQMLNRAGNRVLSEYHQMAHLSHIFKNMTAEMNIVGTIDEANRGLNISQNLHKATKKWYEQMKQVSEGGHEFVRGLEEFEKPIQSLEQGFHIAGGGSKPEDALRDFELQRRVQKAKTGVEEVDFHTLRTTKERMGVMLEHPSGKYKYYKIIPTEAGKADAESFITGDWQFVTRNEHAPSENGKPCEPDESQTKYYLGRSQTGNPEYDRVVFTFPESVTLGQIRYWTGAASVYSTEDQDIKRFTLYGTNKEPEERRKSDWIRLFDARVDPPADRGQPTPWVRLEHGELDPELTDHSQFYDERRAELESIMNSFPPASFLAVTGEALSKQYRQKVKEVNANNNMTNTTGTSVGQHMRNFHKDRREMEKIVRKNQARYVQLLGDLRFIAITKEPKKARMFGKDGRTPVVEEGIFAVMAMKTWDDLEPGEKEAAFGLGWKKDSWNKKKPIRAAIFKTDWYNLPYYVKAYAKTLKINRLWWDSMWAKVSHENNHLYVQMKQMEDEEFALIESNPGAFHRVYSSVYQDKSCGYLCHRTTHTSCEPCHYDSEYPCTKGMDKSCSRYGSSMLYSTHGWIPDEEDHEPWMMVDFGKVRLVHSIWVQGYAGELGEHHWVTAFRVQTTKDGEGAAYPKWYDVDGPKAFGNGSFKYFEVHRKHRDQVFAADFPESRVSPDGRAYTSEELHDRRKVGARLARRVMIKPFQYNGNGWYGMRVGFLVRNDEKGWQEIQNTGYRPEILSIGPNAFKRDLAECQELCRNEPRCRAIWFCEGCERPGTKHNCLLYDNHEDDVEHKAAGYVVYHFNSKAREWLYDKVRRQEKTFEGTGHIAHDEKAYSLKEKMVDLHKVFEEIDKIAESTLNGVEDARKNIKYARKKYYQWFWREYASFLYPVLHRYVAVGERIHGVGEFKVLRIHGDMLIPSGSVGICETFDRSHNKIRATWDSDPEEKQERRYVELRKNDQSQVLLVEDVEQILDAARLYVATKPYPPVNIQVSDMERFATSRIADAFAWLQDGWHYGELGKSCHETCNAIEHGWGFGLHCSDESREKMKESRSSKDNFRDGIGYLFDELCTRVKVDDPIRKAHLRKAPVEGDGVAPVVPSEKVGRAAPFVDHEGFCVIPAVNQKLKYLDPTCVEPPPPDSRRICYCTQDLGSNWALKFFIYRVNAELPNDLKRSYLAWVARTIREYLHEYIFYAWGWQIYAAFKERDEKVYIEGYQTLDEPGYWDQVMESPTTLMQKDDERGNQNVCRIFYEFVVKYIKETNIKPFI